MLRSYTTIPYCVPFTPMLNQRGPAAAGGGNLGHMLVSQNAIYWHADFQVCCRRLCRWQPIFVTLLLRFQAVLVLLFLGIFVIHAELGIHGNVVSDMYNCRYNATSSWGSITWSRRGFSDPLHSCSSPSNTSAPYVAPMCCTHSDLYPFTHWRGGLNATRVLMSLLSIVTVVSVYHFHKHSLALLRLKGSIAPSVRLFRWRKVCLRRIRVVEAFTVDVCV
jgi:hypothetical protein